MRCFQHFAVVLCFGVMLSLASETPPTPPPDPPAGEGRLQEHPMPKDSRAWRLLRIYPSSPSLLKTLVSSLRNNSQAEVVGASEEELFADVGLSPTTTLERVLSRAFHSPLPPLCPLDGVDSGEGRAHSDERRLEVCQGEESPAEGMSLRPKRQRFSLDFLQWKVLGFVQKEPRMNGSEPLAWDDYYRYDSILRFGKKLSLSHPHVEFFEIGKSFEGRPLFALCFASKPTGMKKLYHKKLLKLRRLRAKRGRDPSLAILRKRNVAARKRKKSKPYVLIEAGIHAREWIAPAVATYVAEQLATLGKRFLKHVTVLVVPMTNPDGYEFSHTSDRYWRKNRRLTADPSCPGVDLNRNWGLGWGNPDGSSDDPCSPIYRGAEKFSEPETQALRDLALVWMDKITLYISLHCTGRVILHPWGFMKTPSVNKKQLARIAKVMAKYLHRNNQTFKFGQTSHVLYTASGTSEDYMHGAGVKYSYTLELPEESFVLDPKEILPISRAVWNALICTLGDIARSVAIKSFCETKRASGKKKKKKKKEKAMQREGTKA